MTLLLISKTSMATQIFKLVAKKLDLQIEIKDEVIIENDYDIIVLDTEFIDDDFNKHKKFSKKLGAISKEELTFDKSKDFLIPRPFLPSQLENILKEQIEYIHKQKSTTYSEDDSEIAEITPALDYIETLADDVAKNIELDRDIEDDESIIRFENNQTESILDKNELSKIKNILNNNNKVEPYDNTAELSDEDWLDLSQIIDNAIDEMKGFDFSKSEIVTLILKEHNIENLKPLFNAIDQNIIDKLTRGEEVTMRIKLKED